MRGKSISTLFGLALLVSVAGGAGYAATYSQNAAGGVTKLQSWYSSSTGVWASPSGWWNYANSLTVLANYEKVADDNSYYSAISSTFNNAPTSQGHPNFINNYYDDSGWWALAWIAAYDATGNTAYLSKAETIFTFLTGGWDSVCGGGLYWTTSKNGKNAIPNELFLDVAAKLANRTTGSASASYLSWAQQEWTWFKGSGLINSSNLINDGLNGSCVNNNGTEWTYNQGVILGGLVELYEADQDSTLLPQAEAIANSVLAHLINSNGILIETDVSGGDHPQFKGIFMRNLMALYADVPNNAYQQFIGTNVNSILAHDQSTGYEFGALWQGPFDSADATRQTSALDALIAGIAVQGSASAGPIQENGFGSLEMFATDSSGNVWHNWQKFGVDGASAVGNWAGWNGLTMSGLVAKAGAAATINGIGEQEVFVPSTSGDVFTDGENSPTGGWNGWVDMGSTSNGLGSLQPQNSLYGQRVFGLDSSGAVWVASKNTLGSSWSGFTELTGETVQPGYAVGENASGNLQVFGVDSSGTLWTNTQTGSSTWSGWSSITGKTLQPHLAVVRLLNGPLQIFGIDTGNTDVWSNWQSSPGGSWQSSWQSLGNVGGGVTVQPGFVVGLNAGGSPQMFAVGSNGNAYTTYRQNSGVWTTWSSLAGAPLNPLLTVSSTADGRIQVFAISTTSPYNVESNWETTQGSGGAWNGWASFSGSGKIFYPGQP